MYNLNPLMRPVLITGPEVVFHAPTKHTLDIRTIEQSIIVAEERFIRPALGDALYEAIIESKNLEVTDANRATLQVNMPTGITLANGDLVNALEQLSVANQQLWKMHLWKLVAECVMMLATPEGFVQFSSEGVVHTNPTAGPLTSGNVITPSLGSIKWAMDKKLMDRIDPLTEAMHNWLCKRKEDYPLYDKPCDCDSKGTAHQRRTDFVLGIYDEDEDGGCEC